MKSALSVLQRWMDLDRQLVRGGVKLYLFAEQWGVNYSTVQRDIRAFRAMGQVITLDDRRGHGVGGFGYDGSPPLFVRNLPDGAG
jgi:hypothetical protein